MDIKIHGETEKIGYLNAKMERFKGFTNTINTVLDNQNVNNDTKTKLTQLFDWLVDKINSCSSNINSSKRRINYMLKKKIRRVKYL